VARTARSQTTMVNTEFGKPITVDRFSQWLRAAIKAAGSPLQCQPHGLRKAAGRRLAEAGCSANQIMSVLNHKTLTEAERYARDAEQIVLARAAVIRLEEHKGETTAQTTSAGLGN
jgi:enterobacteria phage integrase